MIKLKSKLGSLPVYLYLLPIFFVFHAFNEFFFLIPISIALELAFIYTGVALGLSLLFWLLYKSFRKASLMSFFVVALVLFYGSIHDFFKDLFPSSLFVRYTFIGPFIVVLIASLVIYLKKNRNQLVRTTQYLNILFLILVIMEIGVLITKLPYNQMPIADTIEGNQQVIKKAVKPDIYFIIADEYGGKQQLKDVFQFDNSRFEDSLRSRGFHVINNPVSNYNWTIYSMASMLNMDYLKNLVKDSVNNYDMMLCTEAIQDNNVVSFLKQAGYEIYNYSFFDILNKSKIVQPAFLPERHELITASTLPKRIQKDIGFHFVSQEALTEAKKRNLRSNQKVEQMTKETFRQSSLSPRFVYTHLMMPHYFYFFDSMGKEMPISYLETESRLDKKAYIQYLVYTNKKLLELTDFIIASSKNPPVIIIMSDHGFRHLDKSVDRKYHYMTINNVLLPDRNYSGFYDGMSNINQFRVILNHLFGQKFPMMKDSTIFIKGY